MWGENAEEAVAIISAAVIRSLAARREAEV